MFRSVAIVALLALGSSGVLAVDSFLAPGQCMEATNPPVILKFEADPTAAPTRAPTRAPTGAPTRVPTTDVPTFVPTSLPTCTRTAVPSSAPTWKPTSTPSNVPSQSPTCTRSKSPSSAPAETVFATAAVTTVDYLGSLCRYAILAETAITNTGTLDLTGDVGLSPTTFAAIVGFGLKLDSKKAFSVSAVVKGQVFAADYRGGTTTADLTVDIRNMEILQSEMAAMTATKTTIAAASISGVEFTPGVYKYIGAITSAAATTVTFNGGADDIFVIQTIGALSLGANTVIELVGGAQAKNIFWTCAAATFGAGMKMKGVLLTRTAATYLAGAEHIGHIYAQTAITMNTGVVIKATPCA